MRRIRDDLLDEPLLSLNELKSYVADLKALQKGEIRGFVGSQFWERVTAEIVRRQANLQIQITNSVRHATWALVIVTIVLTIVTLLPFALHR